MWSALTQPDRMARWPGTYEGERRVGGSGTSTMTHEEEGEVVGEPMTILGCDPPRRLVVGWSGQEDWRVALDPSTEDGRTVLLFTQVFAPGTDVADVATGWHWHLDELDAAVSGRPQPAGWDTFLAEVGPAYGHAPPA